MGCADTASSGRRAFTLVEAMISVMVVAVLGGGILVMWPAIAQLNTLEQERAYAFQLACQQMEASVMVPDFPRIANHQTALVWDNGTPNNPADDTTGTVDVIVARRQDGSVDPDHARYAEPQFMVSGRSHGELASARDAKRQNAAGNGDDLCGSISSNPDGPRRRRGSGGGGARPTRN